MSEISFNKTFQLLVGTLWLNSYCCLSSFHCSNRFEAKEAIKEALPYLNNCTIVRKLYPMCAKGIKVLYSNHPPYVVSLGNGSEPIGLLPDILRLAMDVCCHGCSNITFRGPVDPLEKFKTTNTTLFMPLESAFSSKVVFNHDYIPFLKVRGVSFLAGENSKKATEYTRHLMESVLNTWPLFITAILMAMISGCVMWVLDTWANTDEFPNAFPRGPFEGFWWAFVSMTTVGYGDRAPKSFVARIFAIIWILLGITVFSMYTAVLTSALNTRTDLFRDKNFVNKNVGVLSFTAASEAAVFEEHANAVKFDDIQAMGKELARQKIHAIALDDYIARYYMSELAKHVPGLKRHHRHRGLVNSYGALSYNRNISAFIESFLTTNEDQRHALVSHVMDKRWPNMEYYQENKIDSTTFFSSDSSVFYMTIVGLLIIGMITIGIGFSCRYVFKKNGGLFVKFIGFMDPHGGNINKVDPRIPVEDAVQVSCERQEIANELFEELEEFKKRLERKLFCRVITLNDNEGKISGSREPTL